MMLLNAVVEFAVKPVPNAPGWFEMCGKPLMGWYDSLDDIISDAGDDGWVPGAKIVGIHDNSDVLESDPRFCYEDKHGHSCDRDGEPGVLVTKNGPKQFLGFMYVNTPESVLFTYTSDHDHPKFAGTDPVWRAGAETVRLATPSTGAPHVTKLPPSREALAQRKRKAAAAAKSAPKTKATAKTKAKVRA